MAQNIKRSIRGKKETIKRAYLAGFFDGDGWCSISVSHGYKDKIYPMLAAGVGNNCEEVVRIFKDSYGGSITVETPKKGRILYRWLATGEYANNLLRDLVPFLVVKKRQAKIGLHYYNHRANGTTEWVMKLRHKIQTLNGNSAIIFHPQRLNEKTPLYVRKNRNAPYKLGDATV